MRCSGEEDGIVDECSHPFLPFFSAELRWLNCGKGCAAAVPSLGFRWLLRGQACFSVLQPGNAGLVCIPFVLSAAGASACSDDGEAGSPARRGRCGARAPQDNMLLLNPSSHLPQESTFSFVAHFQVIFWYLFIKTIIWKDLFEKSNTCKSLQTETLLDNWTNGEHDGEYQQTQLNVFIED